MSVFLFFGSLRFILQTTDTNVLLVVLLGNRYIEVAPEDVIWANLGMNPYEQKVHFGFSFLPSMLCLPPQFDDVEVIPPLLFATDMRLAGGVFVTGNMFSCDV